MGWEQNYMQPTLQGPYEEDDDGLIRKKARRALVQL